MTLRHTFTKEEADDYISPNFWGRYPSGFVSVVASKPGIGKTWYMLYYIIEYSKNARIGALIGDCSPVLIYDRIKRITNIANNDNIYGYFLSEIQRENFTLDLTKSEGLRNVERLIKDNKLDLLFIDTLISFITVDESSQKDIGPVMQRLSAIATQTNCAIVINHHLRKSDSKSGSNMSVDEVIGSSVITRLAATVAVLTKSDSVIYVKTIKNWFAEEETTIFSITNLNGAITLSESKQGETRTQTKQELAIEVVKNFEQDKIFTMEEILSLLPDISRPTIARMYHKLIELGLIYDTTPYENKIMDKKLCRC